MISNRTRTFAITAIAFTLALGTASIAQARRANPHKGYLRVLHNLVDKGVNHGRCVATGILAEKILLSGAELPVLIPVHIADACAGRDVYFGDHVVEEIFEDGGE